MWFKIKKDSKIFHGPRHLFGISKLLNGSHLKKNVHDVIDRNSYFAHPENVLLSMIVDERFDVRKIEVDIILKIRNEPHPEIRTFQKPKINYNAIIYYEIINFDAENCFEPSVTKIFSNQELLECVNNKNNVIRKLLDDIPLHTQAVERAIKMVSETSTAVNGEEKQNGVVYAKIALKNLLKTENTKKDYVNFMNNNNLFE